MCIIHKELQGFMAILGVQNAWGFTWMHENLHGLARMCEDLQRFVQIYGDSKDLVGFARFVQDSHRIRMDSHTTLFCEWPFNY